MNKPLPDAKAEIRIAHAVSAARYPEHVKVVSEPSAFYEDQIIFSYPFYRIVFCTSGQAEYKVFKQGVPARLDLCQGDAMIIKPRAFIKSINCIPYETCGILLRDFSIDYFTNDHRCGHRHRFMLPIRYVQKTMSILFEQAVEFSDHENLLRLYAMLTWAHVTETLIKQCQPTGSHSTFYKAKSYVDKHFQLGINRKIVAAELGLNQDYLNTLFRRFSGLNFTQYLLKIKLEKANDLMYDKKISISKIAKLCGFNSSTYFGRQFKKQYHMTPQAYRKKMI